MSMSNHSSLYTPGTVSPLVLADQLLTLAQDAERSGMHRPAQQLLQLAYAVYDEKPHRV